MPDTSIQMGDRTYRVEPPTGRKAHRVLQLAKELAKTQRSLSSQMAAFRRTYEGEHFDELTRVQALMEYPPRPLVDDDRQPIRDGDGELIMIASPVDRITQADWEASGDVFRRPSSPTPWEAGVATFQVLADDALDAVVELVALCTLTNADVKAAHRDGTLDDRIKARAADLLDDGDLADLLELSVIVAEVVEQQITGRLDRLGDRVGKAAARLGLNLNPRTTPPSSTPDSSTASPAPTDGDPTSRSTPTTGSSSTSNNASSTTPNVSAKQPETPPA